MRNQSRCFSSSTLSNMAPATPIQEEDVPTMISDLNADILQTILSCLPYPDLVAASFVSREWCRHVHLSLLAHPRPHPWLLLHQLPHHHSQAYYAFDPHSRTWFHLPSSSPPIDADQLLSSHPAMLYHLCPSSLSVSLDPLAPHGAWVDLGPPRSWRLDPLVALIGANQVVVAGGYDPLGEDDPLSVDAYSIVSPGDRRRSCQPLPAVFKNSASRVWLCAAASENRMFVLEKCSGDFSSLDLAAGEWLPATLLRPDPCIYYSVIGYSGGRLILLGLMGTAQSPTGLRIWEVQNVMHDRLSYECTELGEMPTDMLEALVERSPDGELPAVEMCAMGGMVYVYDPSDPGEIVHCEMSGDGLCKWGVDPNPVLDSDDSRMRRLLFTCSRVGIDRLREAYSVKNGV